MKVKKLIKNLQDYNPEADITLTTSEDITIAYISKDNDGNRYTRKTTKQCFIEGIDQCPQCVHEYMNGDDRWCSFYDCECREVEDCYQFEEFYEP